MEKYFDIAAKSDARNYGVDMLPYFYEQLKVEEDKNMIEYYLLLMELYL